MKENIEIVRNIFIILFSIISLAAFSSGNDLIFKMFSSAGTNTYIIGKGKEAVIIDAGGNTKQMLDYIKQYGLTIQYIILTHGHDDHFKELPKLTPVLKCKTAIHQYDFKSLAYVKIYKADLLLKGGEVLELCGLKFEIIHTPGHTGGGICIKVGNKLFSGDTLFFETIGNTVSKSSSYEKLIASIKEKLLILDDKTEIYPGHGGSTTIGHERTFNGFLK